MTKPNPLDSIPYHDGCGLPVELCPCPDAPIRFENGQFKERGRRRPYLARRVGDALYFNLDVPDSEDEARRLVEESNGEIKTVCLETSELECPVCDWAKGKTLIIDCELGTRRDPPTWTKCQQCGHHIELSIELLSMVRRAFDGKI